MPAITCVWSDGRSDTWPNVNGHSRTRSVPSLKPLPHQDSKNLLYRQICGRLLAQHVFGGAGSTQPILNQLCKRLSTGNPNNTNASTVVTAPEKNVVSARHVRPNPKSSKDTLEKQPKYSSQIYLTDSFENYYLASLPTNYQLYQRDSNRENGNGKREFWLYGHPSGRPFRSVNDFLHHLYWLISDLTRNESTCCCVLCSGNMTRVRKNLQKENERMFHECKDDTYTWPSSYRLGEVVWIDINNELIPAIIVARNLINYESNQMDAVKLISDTFVEPYQYHCKQLGNSRYYFDMAAADIEPWSRHPPDLQKQEHLVAHSICQTWNLFGIFQPLEGIDMEEPKFHDENYSIPLTVLPTFGGESNSLDDHFYGIFRGAEKLWINDLCVISTSSLPSVLQKTSFMYISDIYVNEDDIVCFQGSLWTQIDKNALDYNDSADNIDEHKDDLKELPRRLQMVSKLSNTYFRCLHDKSVEYVCPFADVLGRWYEPWFVKGDLNYTSEVKERTSSRLSAVGSENWVDDDFYEYLLSEIDMVSAVVM